MKVLIVGRTPNSTDSKDYTERTIETIRAIAEAACVEHKVALELHTGSFINRIAERMVNLDKPVDDIDVAVVIGGDGTMLQAAKKLAMHDIPVIGVNLGKVGFITDIPARTAPQEVTALLDQLSCSVDYLGQAEVRGMLNCLGRELVDYNPHVSNFALNDIVISRDQPRIIELEVTIDAKFAFRARADGLLFSTSTGSTAYALGTGAPIIHPRAKVFELVPMMPQTLSQRPIVLSDDSNVKVELLSGTAEVIVDGDRMARLKPGSSMVIFRASKSVQFIHPEQYDYMKTLREKLGWQQLPGRS